MNKEVWYQIFRDWVKSYDAINHLEKKGILDDEETIIAKANLLKDMIETMLGEIEDE